MTTITLPPDLETRISEEASRRGTSPELLALDGLRRLFPPAGQTAEATLHDFLQEHIGTLEGSAEPLSEDCGRRFAEGLAAASKKVR